MLHLSAAPIENDLLTVILGVLCPRLAKECGKGQAIMCAKQAWMIKNSIGVEYDDAKLFEIASRACELGHNDICTRLKRGEFDYAKP